MVIHFHIGSTACTVNLGKRDLQGAKELDEKTTALVWYGLHFPREGQIARYVLRKWAGGER